MTDKPTPKRPQRPVSSSSSAAKVGQNRRPAAPDSPAFRPKNSASQKPQPKTAFGGKVVVREGEDGTDLAAEGRVAVIVDALRASATICALLEAGAKEVWVTAEVEDCRALAAETANAVTVGERGGKKLAGFNLGNSPLTVQKSDLSGKTVVMTTTTGALRIVSSQGAAQIFIGGPRNLSAVAQVAAEYAQKRKADVVVVAAGDSDGPEGMAAEDLASASLIAGKLRDMGATLEPGGFINLPAETLPDLFRNCPHGRKLKEIGYGADVPHCAEIDKTKIVPYVADWIDLPDGDIAAVVRIWSRPSSG